MFGHTPAGRVKTFIQRLGAAHAEKKGDTADNSYIVKLNEFLEQKASDEALLGAMQFFAKKRNPSVLSRMLEDFINNSIHPESEYKSNEQRIVCVKAFYDFANANKKYLADFAEHKEDIAAHNKAQLAPLTKELIERVEPQLDELYEIALMPLLTKLIRNLPQEYKAEKDKQPKGNWLSTWLPLPIDETQKRKRCLAVTNILNPDSINQTMRLYASLQGKSEVGKAHQVYTIQRGYLTYLMLSIGSTYKVTSPTNSVLYTQTRNILNRNKKLTRHDQMKDRMCLQSFSDFALYAKDQKTLMDPLEATKEFSTKTPPKVFLENMRIEIANDFKGVLDGYVLPATTYAATAVFTFALGIQVGNFAGYLFNKGLGKGLLPALFGMVGRYYGGKMGEKLARYTAEHQEAILMPIIFAKVLTFVIYGTTNKFLNPRFETDKELIKLCQALDENLRKTILTDEWMKEAKNEFAWLEAVKEFAPEQVEHLIKRIIEAATMNLPSATPEVEVEKTAAPACGK